MSDRTKAMPVNPTDEILSAMVTAMTLAGGYQYPLKLVRAAYYAALATYPQLDNAAATQIETRDDLTIVDYRRDDSKGSAPAAAPNPDTCWHAECRNTGNCLDPGFCKAKEFAAPSKLLLLSAEQIRPLRLGNHSIYDTVCGQALIAIEQEQRIVELEREIAELKARIR